MNKIYFDHSATTPADLKVLEAMLPYFSEKFGNSSSIHSFGQEALRGVDEARDKLSQFLGCKSKEVIFTSGATESNNMAIIGVISAIRDILKKKNKKEEKLHIITSLIEHPAILEPCQRLEKEGIEVTFLAPDKNGIVSAKEIEKNIKENTVLVSLMYVNNEVGTIQPIADAGEIIRREKVRREKKKGLPIIFHSDAVQAINYCNCNVDYLKVDLLSLSGHKIYGPKGVGAIYIKEGTPIKAIQFGGHQEYGFRAGTVNSPLIVGLGKAIDLINRSVQEINDNFLISKDNNKVKELRDYLIDKVIKEVPDSILNGDKVKRIPSNANFIFKGVEGESILLMLDMEGIAISTGSACAAGSLKPSHVLLAMGVKQELAHGSIRITLGKGNTQKDVDEFIEVLKKVIKRLREMAPK